MLSYINRIVRDFRRDHGIEPNLLYLNDVQAHHLKEDFAEQYSYASISELLGMEIIVSRDIVHPHVAWSQAASRKAV